MGTRRNLDRVLRVIDCIQLEEAKRSIPAAGRCAGLVCGSFVIFGALNRQIGSAFILFDETGCARRQRSGNSRRQAGRRAGELLGLHSFELANVGSSLCSGCSEE